MSNNYEQFKACLKLVMSQTNYDEKKATEKLKQYNNDFILVIKEYLNPDFNKKPEPEKIKKNQINQHIIRQIRDFKDKQANIYKKNKEYNEQLKKLYIKRMKEQENQKKQQKTAENKELKHLDSIKEISEDSNSEKDSSDQDIEIHNDYVNNNEEKIDINI